MQSVQAGRRATPPLLELEKILLSSEAVERGTETAEDLRYLQGKGTSLGGINAASAHVALVHTTPVAIIRRFDRATQDSRIPYMSGATLLQASRTDEHAYTMPDKDRKSKTWLSEDTGPITSLAQLMSQVSKFSLDNDQALNILQQVVNAVLQWRTVGQSIDVGMTSQELDEFELAFDHPDLEEAKQFVR